MLMNQLISPNSKTFTERTAIGISQDVCAALAYLQSLSPVVVHRDIKLENVLLAALPGGVIMAKLADFGLHTVGPRNAVQAYTNGGHVCLCP